MTRIYLRPFTGGCRARSAGLFSVRRADIVTVARELEGRGRPSKQTLDFFSCRIVHRT